MRLSKNAFFKYSLLALLGVNAVLVGDILTEKKIEQKKIEAVTQEFNREVECLAKNIYYEAAGESFEGKLAVAQVTMNRVNSGKFSHSVCRVVSQKDIIHGSMVCQFSWVCKPELSHPNKYVWEECLYVAKKALTNQYTHDTLYKLNALYYHSNQVSPEWNLRRVGQVGNHIFYKEKV